MAPKMFELPPPGGARTRDVGRLIDVIVFAVPPIPDIFRFLKKNQVTREDFHFFFSRL